MASHKTLLSQSLNIVKLLYTPISLIFIVYFAYINKELLKKMVEVADWHLILISISLWCLLHLLSPISPKIILAILGSKITYSNLLRIHISVLPSKYLPGGIWHTVGRMTAYYSHGVPKKKLAFLAIIETFSPCVLTLFFGGGILWLTGDKRLLSCIEGILSLVNFIILLVAPFIVRWKLPSYWNINLLYSYLAIILISIFFWLIASASFLSYYTSASVTNAPFSLLQAAAIYIFSWGIGYISIFAPQGIGVFEAVASKLLPLPMTFGGTVAFLAGFRILILIADAITWISYRLYMALFQKTIPEKSTTIANESH